MTTVINSPTEAIARVIEQQRQFFNAGKTKDLDFRRQQLEKLKTAIKQKEEQIIAALHQDLCKPELEGYIEMAVLQDINYALKHLKSWAKKKKVKTPLTQFPASAYIYAEPLGNVLIIGPWNYPFSLIISPLIGAIAAGNCTILKPSELAPQTSRVLTELINDTFPPEYIAVIEGGVKTSQALLAENFDHIFFTGGTKIGKIVMEAAAKNLTPVTLELGGKSPCIVDSNIDLKETAKRITWGKFLNAGQTCIAPDYLLANKQIKTELIAAIKQCIRDFYGDNPQSSPDFARIINRQQFDRLQGLLADGTVILGGETKAEDLYISPTLITDAALDSPLMAEEIFGPILPILEYDNLQNAIALINSRSKPLALYIFSKDKDIQEQILMNTSSGGVCINDTVMQVGVNELPFGGVGDSGIGSYHGKASFDTFSHQKSVLKKSFLLDFNWRYAPYADKLGLFKKLTQ
ncbi:aldehyde dehydrogenase [Waterburya agarophytonicola K14]|uniref:Aldehyde dehydrogenase n=1 Tax=Waterburya agarophytonicola KI4 TaxID=2874699 RepID=A0A964BTL6_9CYAN|nr:aldehyde dehydrogenase [Waterburya agarophytonicola]MCC0179433.1 aldehyde dehydrogenase [Waterburya agarophytonicola KI4]